VGLPRPNKAADLMFPGGATHQQASGVGINMDQGGNGWDTEAGVTPGRGAQDWQGRVAKHGEGEKSKARMDISAGSPCLPKVS